ncbi:hypothetical protein NKR23_g9322 [Pleurostoma richardsiae]|uniref:Uncharacterized protein n=1 Tax=Pleurostoma richardsiae TaxID=41990 RepID=A0AA38VJN5_9PEZI|nr:hypothetical protein NKR23_g9322 [Pleurostoma richardsiae]
MAPETRSRTSRTSVIKPELPKETQGKKQGRPRKRKAAADGDAEDLDGASHKMDSTASGESRRSAATWKKAKRAQASMAPVDDSRPRQPPIIINRSPVLELWGACVASFLHPELPWDLCLSIGSSISTITAISKGRSIGTIAPPDPNRKGEDRAKKTPPTLKVMGFPMVVEGNAVVVKGKLRSVKEVNLIGKYGKENYKNVREAMHEALKSWRGAEDEVDLQAFHMYEQFRPQVPKGRSGWGRKGELSLAKIKTAVQR